jgi:hypothetical protein
MVRKSIVSAIAPFAVILALFIVSGCSAFPRPDGQSPDVTQQSGADKARSGMQNIG